jgi:AcrR family transcriptional regulator
MKSTRVAKTKPRVAKRLRRKPDDVRSEALQAARRLLLTAGPEAITLPAVAKELGMAHGNITHHFGSMAALHASLVDLMAQELAAAVLSAVHQLRDGEAKPVEVVDAVFNAFGSQGAGRLISWLASTGNMKALGPLLSSIAKMVRDLSATSSNVDEQQSLLIRQNTLTLIATGIGNAVIGDLLHVAVGLPAGTLNRLSTKDILRRIEASKRSRAGSAS